mmetsp:Transcript_2481/g.4466  ORF Transcript_2481/g.4466 Transcript_2481/m.4466 type:complete len:137 (+) Transcript_2481:109-519(+)
MDLGGQRALSGGKDSQGCLRLWDINKQTSLHDMWGHVRGALCVTVVWPQQRALSGDGAGTLRLWDLEHGVLTHTFNSADRSAVLSIAMDWPREKALSGSESGALRLWDLYEGTRQAPLRELSGNINGAWSVSVSWR